jgi:hypothetical protein
MGLESKQGALRALGEEFPLEKLDEIRKELMNDAESEGALNLIKAQISKQLMDLTGMMVGPDGTATPMDPMMMGDGDLLGDGELGPASPDGSENPEDQMIQEQQMAAEAQIKQNLINEAYGDNPPTRRLVDKD